MIDITATHEIRVSMGECILEIRNLKKIFPYYEGDYLSKAS